MAKQAYKIPADLNATVLDMEIAIQSKDGVGVKPLPIKIILVYIISVLLCFYVVANTFIGKGSIFQIIVFVITWAGLTVVLAKHDKTKRMQAQSIPTLINYFPKANRYITTRKSSSALPFYRIVGIKNIDENSGLVEWEDGSFGYWYNVVGSASILLFEEDRNAIINRVDAFYRKLGTDADIGFITTKESQKVYRQVASLKRRYDALPKDAHGNRDPDLEMLANEQFFIFRDYVGGTFKSIHQYLFIKADNKEALLQTKNVVQSEVENSSLMIKRCTAMYKSDIEEVLQTIYRGTNSKR